MSPKKIKTSMVEKSDAGNYWQRAQELLESMKNNLLLEKWNAAVVKSHVEYGPSLVTHSEAKRVSQDVERFIQWAAKIYQMTTPKPFVKNT